MNEAISVVLLIGAIFILATIFNVATYLFFVLLELIGEGVRYILRSKHE